MDATPVISPLELRSAVQRAYSSAADSPREEKRMKFSVQWLKEWCPVDLSPDELATRLTAVEYRGRPVKTRLGGRAWRLNAGRPY